MYSFSHVVNIQCSMSLLRWIGDEPEKSNNLEPTKVSTCVIANRRYGEALPTTMFRHGQSRDRKDAKKTIGLRIFAGQFWSHVESNVFVTIRRQTGTSDRSRESGLL